MNPFIFDKYAHGESFCGRTQEIQTLKERCIAGSNSLIYGRRRFGKTSLIKKTFEKLDKKDFICVYVDLFDANDELDVAKLIYAACAESMSAYTKIKSGVKNFFKKINLSMSVDMEGGVSFTPQLSEFSFDEYLNDALSSIDKFAKDHNKRIVIAIDEFQQISTIKSPIDATIRKHLQEKANITWMFSGSKRHLLTELFLDQSRPLYKQAEGLEVKGINDQEFYEFAKSKFPCDLEPEVFNVIYQMADSETKLIQQICNKIYTRVKTGDAESIDENLVRSVVNAILDAEDGIYRMLDGNLKPNQRKALRHLVRFGGTSLMSHDNLKQTNISKSSLNTALKSLYDGIKGNGYLIDKDYDSYFIPDRTFEIWLYRITLNRLPA